MFNLFLPRLSVGTREPAGLRRPESSLHFRICLTGNRKELSGAWKEVQKWTGKTKDVGFIKHEIHLGPELRLMMTDADMSCRVSARHLDIKRLKLFVAKCCCWGWIMLRWKPQRLPLAHRNTSVHHFSCHGMIQTPVFLLWLSNNITVDYVVGSETLHGWGYRLDLKWLEHGLSCATTVSQKNKFRGKKDQMHRIFWLCPIACWTRQFVTKGHDWQPQMCGKPLMKLKPSTLLFGWMLLFTRQISKSNTNV